MGYAPVSAGYASPRTDGLAIGSLSVGVLSLVGAVGCLGVLLGPAAAFMGFIARQRVTASGGAVAGGVMAIASGILGIIGFVLSVAWFFIVISFIVTSSSSTSTPSP
jgi:hypothetical protein